MAKPIPGLNLTAHFEGPFFTRNPRLTFRQNVRAMMTKLASEAEADVRTEISAHQGSMPGWDGWSVAHVKGYTTGVRTGTPWALSMAVNVVATSKADAIRTNALIYGRNKGLGSDDRNRGTMVGIEGRFHPFRHVASRIRGMKAIMAADLTKGME